MSKRAQGQRGELLGVAARSQAATSEEEMPDAPRVTRCDSILFSARWKAASTRQLRLRQCDPAARDGPDRSCLGVAEQGAHDLGAALDPAQVRGQPTARIENAELRAGGDRLLEVPARSLSLESRWPSASGGDAADRLQARKLAVRKPSSASSSVAKRSSMAIEATALRPRSER